MKYSNRRCLVLNSWPDTLPAYENGYNIPVKKGFLLTSSKLGINLVRMFLMFFRSFFKEYISFIGFIFDIIDRDNSIFVSSYLLPYNYSRLFEIFIIRAIRYEFRLRSSPQYKRHSTSSNCPLIEPGLRTIVHA